MTNQLNPLSKQKLKALQEQLIPGLLHNINDLMDFINRSLKENTYLPSLPRMRTTPPIITFDEQVSVFSDLDEPCRFVVSPLNLAQLEEDDDDTSDDDLSTTSTSMTPGEPCDDEQEPLLFEYELPSEDNNSISPPLPCASASLSDDSINTPLVVKEQATRLINDLEIIASPPERIITLLAEMKKQIQARGTEYLESEEACVHVRATRTILACCRGRYVNLLNKTDKHSEVILEQLRSYRSLYKLFDKTQANDERIDELKLLFGITNQTIWNLDRLYKDVASSAASTQQGSNDGQLMAHEYYALHREEFEQSEADLRVQLAKFEALTAGAAQSKPFSWSWLACCTAENETEAPAANDTRSTADNSAKCTIM